MGQWGDSKQVSKEEVGEDRTAFFRAHGMGFIPWCGTVSIVSGHK
jgi:hypothetical protein